jgi:feruloyl-CoA synthase
MPLASPALAPALVNVARRADGTLVLESPRALGDHPRHVGERLRHWAEVAPDRVFLGERDGGGWRRVTYAAARRTVDRLAQALLDRGLSAERPLLILSENGVDHALLTLAAMQAGVPAAPVSPAYSLLSTDLEKLRAIAAILAPGMIYAADADRYGRALAALGPGGAVLVAGRGASGATLPFDALLQREPGPEVEERFHAQGPDAIAKVLFTSGSTGQPKGVINTQRMLCSNQRAIEEVWPFVRERPPVVLDWLPWSHTFGANHNFNLVLFQGGTLYVDDGKPTPELVGRTAQNLREISPTMYFNVPRGFDMLLPYLERDAALRDAFFRELDVIFYAAASLPNPLWERLEALSLASRGELVLMLSAWGSTETAPMATTVHFRIRRAGVIGLPAPGTAVKLTPSGAKLELRVKGPNVTPGYWKRPDLTAAAFDEEGFFRMGDAGRLVDPDDPARGIAFDGRIAEDFKLASATWVHVGALRTSVIAAGAPLIQDAVVAGLDRDEIGLLLFLNPAEAATRPDTRGFLEEALRRYNAENPASSHRIGRAVVLTEPPSIDANEITDKGYINQRAVLERRAAIVERLYSTDAPEVIRF